MKSAGHLAGFACPKPKPKGRPAKKSAPFSTITPKGLALSPGPSVLKPEVPACAPPAPTTAPSDEVWLALKACSLVHFYPAMQKHATTLPILKSMTLSDFNTFFAMDLASCHRLKTHLAALAEDKQSLPKMALPSCASPATPVERLRSSMASPGPASPSTQSGSSSSDAAKPSSLAHAVAAARSPAGSMGMRNVMAGTDPSTLSTFHPSDTTTQATVLPRSPFNDTDLAKLSTLNLDFLWSLPVRRTSSTSSQQETLLDLAKHFAIPRARHLAPPRTCAASLPARMLDSNSNNNSNSNNKHGGMCL